MTAASFAVGKFIRDYVVLHFFIHDGNGIRGCSTAVRLLGNAIFRTPIERGGLKERIGIDMVVASFSNLSTTRSVKIDACWIPEYQTSFRMPTIFEKDVGRKQSGSQEDLYSGDISGSPNAALAAFTHGTWDRPQPRLYVFPENLKDVGEVATYNFHEALGDGHFTYCSFSPDNSKIVVTFVPSLPNLMPRVVVIDAKDQEVLSVGWDSAAWKLVRGHN